MGVLALLCSCLIVSLTVSYCMEGCPTINVQAGMRVNIM